MLKVEFKISTISIPRKAWFCDPSLYLLSAKKHAIWDKLGASLAKFSKIHPILQIGGIARYPEVAQTISTTIGPTISDTRREGWQTKRSYVNELGFVTITHPSIYQNLRKCTSKPLSIPVYHYFVSENPPGGKIGEKRGKIGKKRQKSWRFFHFALLTNGVARMFGAHGQRTLRGSSPYFITLFLWPRPHTPTQTLHTFISIIFMILNTALFNQYIHLMVYFGNLGPFDDAMGKMGPLHDVMINWTPW